MGLFFFIFSPVFSSEKKGSSYQPIQDSGYELVKKTGFEEPKPEFLNDQPHHQIKPEQTVFNDIGN